MALSAEIFRGTHINLHMQESAKVVLSPKKEEVNPLDNIIIDRHISTPKELKPGKNVATPNGTWFMDGELTIFDARKITQPQTKAEHVQNLNEYISRAVEEELAQKEEVKKQTQPQPAKKFAHFRGIVAAAVSSIGGI